MRFFTVAFIANKTKEKEAFDIASFLSNYLN